MTAQLGPHGLSNPSHPPSLHSLTQLPQELVCVSLPIQQPQVLLPHPLYCHHSGPPYLELLPALILHVERISPSCLQGEPPPCGNLYPLRPPPDSIHPPLPL